MAGVASQQLFQFVCQQTGMPLHGCSLQITTGVPCGVRYRIAFTPAVVGCGCTVCLHCWLWRCGHAAAMLAMLMFFLANCFQTAILFHLGLCIRVRGCVLCHGLTYRTGTLAFAGGARILHSLAIMMATMLPAISPLQHAAIAATPTTGDVTP